MAEPLSYYLREWQKGASLASLFQGLLDEIKKLEEYRDWVCLNAPEVDERHSRGLGQPVQGKSEYRGCHADRDGDCTWEDCPQNRDGEPMKSGRHCPLDVIDPEY